MKYNEYKNLSYPQIGDEVLKFWKDNKIFEASVDVREGAPGFTFFEGPPSANGTPGIHHVMARTIKDIFCRYKTLKGFQVKRKGGWDTHGLPVELQVEKELGITKEDIGKTISVAEYNLKCRETVMKFTDQWNDLTEKMGYWVDLDDPYITYKNEYIESLWYLLKKLYDKGLLYKGYTIQPYSPAAGTGLSSHELNMPGTYKDVKDTTIVAMFKVKASENSEVFKEAADQDIRILAWTTTPWTLPANSALTVGASISYVLVKTFNPYTHEPVSVVLAKDLIGKYFSEKGKDADFEAYAASDKKLLPWSIVSEFKGRDIEGVEYEQLLPYIQPDKPAFRVILGDFVTTEDGTGVVHTSPTFGADDFRVAQANGIPSIMVKDETGKEVPIVDRQGRFVKEITDYAGRYVKPEYYTEAEQNDPEFRATDVLIAIRLKEEGKAFKVEKYEHPYPHCWRTDKPVLYYPLDSWFIKTTALKERMVELNKTINWKPESTGTGRFGNWLENLVDWNLSRSRYWGTPLPIWRSEYGEEVCIGSIEQLKDLLEEAIISGHLTREQSAHNSEYLLKLQHGDFDLHRPYVDTIVLISKSGHVMHREPDLVDVWFDSGAMPYAQWHYPFENEDIYHESYPADFISEGVDQTRGWFFTLHAIAAMLFDSVAFKNVVSTGLVLDKNGNKMSKRLGNAVDPFETLGKYGPDATRWYMITNAEPWDNLKFNVDGIIEVQRKFFGTLVNTYNFFALYANLDGYTFDESKSVAIEKRTELDRWILSKLNTLIREVKEQLDDYNPTKAGRLVQDFVTDQLSNWYIRLNRRRFWNPSQGTDAGLTEDKQAAYETLQHCLVTVSQLMSPIAPFFGEWLYKNLTDGLREDAKKNGTLFRFDSVHLTLLDEIENDFIDTDLEEAMQLAQSVSSLVHSIRKKHKIKVRQPLNRLLIPALNDKTKRQIQQVEFIIKSEVNVKHAEAETDDSGVFHKRAKPNFKLLGKKFGRDMQAVAENIKGWANNEIEQLERDGLFLIESLRAEILPEEVEIYTEDVPGWLVASEGGLTVALDITVTEELRLEGIARDFVNRVQNLRKDSGFDVTDKISITLENNNELLASAVLANKEYICQEVQAFDLTLVSDLNGSASEIEMDEFLLKVSIEVVS
ncbi:Isoleucine--tRNA ligase [Dyadobacter sp. CECT 9275]|uniref:Isoleucine--tRNA ligase n=1 Tax=Dyadobacter helix TaxID=2822344 RepID=A0A916JDR6_9BACT|nr:isoleucine--tRNA ligase [Dyadobacter sp. CECT 9275]CAG5005292.1 Isoleucine--tRNA ligase [Dyadobacter sp. CECT 9275]